MVEEISIWNPLMTVVVLSLRHQLFLLIPIFLLLPKAKVEETIPREKNPQKQKERKDAGTQDIRSFFEGATIIKSSGLLNSKENKIIKID